MSKSQMKGVLITFFDTGGIIHFELIPQDQIVNQAYYVKILKWLHDAVRRKRPELWVLHHGNVSAHKAFSVPQFLAHNSITEMKHSPYSPHLAPNDLWLFPKLKPALKRPRFQDTEDIQKKKKKVTTALEAIPQQVFQKRF
jgi:hypothetical protein